MSSSNGRICGNSSELKVGLMALTVESPADGDRLPALHLGHPPASPAHPANNHARTTPNAAVASRPRLRVSQ